MRAPLRQQATARTWWTTDIGGFHGGRADDPYFRELMIRWFQFGVFCPITRLHGDREPRMTPGPAMTGGPNEVWSFGQEVYAVLAAQLALRERLRPYLAAQMAVASTTGVPMMRPVFVDFPGDERAWGLEDQYMFGDDLLVCPVIGYGQRERQVYLPGHGVWRDAWTGAESRGGATLTAPAPLDRIPVYLRAGSALDLGPA